MRSMAFNTLCVACCVLLGARVAAGQLLLTTSSAPSGGFPFQDPEEMMQAQSAIMAANMAHIMRIAEQMSDVPDDMFGPAVSPSSGLFRPMDAEESDSDERIPRVFSLLRRVSRRPTLRIRLGFIPAGGDRMLMRPQGDRCPCAKPAHDLCADVIKGGGNMLKVAQCLRKQGDAVPAECRQRLHRSLAGACGDDIQQYCPNVQPGHNRLHTCLAPHAKQLSPSCAAYFGKHVAASSDNQGAAEAEGSASPALDRDLVRKLRHGARAHRQGVESAQQQQQQEAASQEKDEEGDQRVADAETASEGQGPVASGRAALRSVPRWALLTGVAAGTVVLALVVVGAAVYHRRRQAAIQAEHYRLMMT